MIEFIKQLLGIRGAKPRSRAHQSRTTPQRSTPVQHQPRTTSGAPRTPPPPPPPRVNGQIDRPSRQGHTTGFEPRVLRDYHAPISVNARGIAGLGLFDTSFEKHRVYTGQLGEVALYKALCKEDLIDNVSSFWSVALPGDDGRAVADAKFQTDVDCVVVQGNEIYLIDLKYYSSGDVTWHSEDGEWLLCRDNTSGSQVGKPRKMSRNMAMAQQRFPKIFPQHRVRSFVVLVPTNAGIGLVAPGTAWPGAVPLITLPDMLAIIRSAPAALADPATASALSGLVQE